MIKIFFLVPLLVLLQSCATQTVPEQPQEEIAVAEQPEKPTVPGPQVYPSAPFDKETLYQLLVAEVAGYRQEYDTALRRYVQMAEETRDPAVAARATRLATYLKRNKEALKTAKIWAEVDPDNLDAHRFAADQLMKVGDLQGAIIQMEAVKRLGGFANFDVFAYRAANLDVDSRKALLATVSSMLEKYPEDEQLMFSKAVLLEQSGQLEGALSLANQLLQGKIDVNVIILKVNALKNLQRADEAVEFLGDAVKELAENRRLRLMYGRLLFEAERLGDARQQYEWILQRSPNDGDILFALALITMEQKDDDAARGYLGKMVRWNRRASEAHFYLGSLAERAGDSPEAIREYQLVDKGYEYLPAQARIVSLMMDDGRLVDAHDYLVQLRAQDPELAVQLIMLEGQLLIERGFEEQVFALLDQAEVNNPDNVDLLYYRAMTGERFGHMDILERDLRKIINLEPDNADALNALGYSLADKTDRHEEALTLIQRALKIKPDEAAFIDSMGWVMYRLKNYDEAERYLREALKLLQNDEVAAHLGEVLWAKGEKRAAEKVWRKALNLKPESEILQKVIQRFDGK